MQAKGVPPQNYEKECAYFQEVDAFELLEESPSPQNKTWVMGTKDRVPESHISSVLKKWLITLKQNHGCGPSPSLSKILETPGQSRDTIYDGTLDFSSLMTSVKTSLGKYHSSEEIETVDEKESEDIEFAIRNLSLSSRDSLLDDQPWDPLLALLAVCGQSSPSTFSDVLSEYWLVFS